MFHRFRRWLFNPRHRLVKLVLAAVFLSGAFCSVTQIIQFVRLISEPRSRTFIQWATGDRVERAELITARRQACPGAPFILPAEGFIGLLYADPRGPYSQARPHQGIDIFSNADPGVTPVFAAYDGYVTREPGWVSSLIMRVPDDPFHPGTQIWLYYTHMADSEGQDFIADMFPAGTREKFVEQGTLLGHTGNYNGNSPRNVWVHLHFSIVRDDGNGRYTNELNFDNTIDPSPYLGMDLNYATAPGTSECA